MLFALALILAPAPAKLVIVGPKTTVISYPTWQRCVAAKLAFERQEAERERRDSARGYISGTGPSAYCIPS